MGFIIALIILVLCCILNNVPIEGTLIGVGMAFIAQSYRLTKKGDVDLRCKTNFIRLAIGLGLIVIGVLLI